LFIRVYNAPLSGIGCEFISPTFVSRDRIFTDTRIHRAPDCGIGWQERNIRTVALTTAIRLSDEEKLEALRRLDQFRQWHSLDEKRYCLVCGKLISGRQIQVAGGTRGNDALRLNCPTEQCNSIPMDWVLPTDEVLAKVERRAEEERKASLKPAAVTVGNGQTVHTDKSHRHFVSRLIRLAFHLKRHAKLSPLIPAGLEPPGGSAG
jgi:hypothetical protein